MNKVYSDFGKINWYDLVKGAFVAVLAAVVPSILAITNNGLLPSGEEWRTIGITGISAFLGYVVKQFFTNSDGTLVKQESDGKSS